MLSARFIFCFRDSGGILLFETQEREMNHFIPEYQHFAKVKYFKLLHFVSFLIWFCGANLLILHHLPEHH